MARLYSKKKGKSGSKKPIKKIPSWAPYQGKEVEKLIIKFAKAGKTSSEIGMILRDSYGVNSVKAVTQRSVSAVLEENKLAGKLPEDILSLIKKMIIINQHLEKNRHDETAKRGLILTSSKLKRLIDYYKKSKRLPADWVMDTERLKMYLE